MFGISTLRTVTNAAFERRRRRQAFQILNGLSPEVKKDIGWPAAADAFTVGTRGTGPPAA